VCCTVLSVASQVLHENFHFDFADFIFCHPERPRDIHHKSTTSTMASIASETKTEDIYVRGESDIFEYLNAQLKKRILILDGAMGTMIQKHRFTEEDVRINSILHYPL
jgi:hypothetical protein